MRVVPGEAGYYLFPDFEVCRRGLNQAGIYNGHQMCKAMLDEVAVCVSSHIYDECQPAEALSMPESGLVQTSIPISNCSQNPMSFSSWRPLYCG